MADQVHLEEGGGSQVPIPDCGAFGATGHPNSYLFASLGPGYHQDLVNVLAANPIWRRLFITQVVGIIMTTLTEKRVKDVTRHVLSDLQSFWGLTRNELNMPRMEALVNGAVETVLAYEKACQELKLEALQEKLQNLDLGPAQAYRNFLNDKEKALDALGNSTLISNIPLY